MRVLLPKDIMPNTKVSTITSRITEPEYVPIKVTAGVILHIGAGIYSSVAGAIKELVSNSFDADATQVIINTNYPNFDEIKVVDNGVGMSAVRFKQAMQSIGSSLKGTLDTVRFTKSKRPIIGHLGIGLMALSQVCAKAEIESQIQGSDTKFVAILDFSEFQRREQEQIEIARFNQDYQDPQKKEELDKLLANRKTTRTTRSKIKKLKDAALKQEDENMGYCLIYRNVPAVRGEFGTTITLKQIRHAVKDLLSDQGRSTEAFAKQFGHCADWAEYRDQLNEWSWETLCDRLRISSNQFAHHNLPMYHQFLWELSLMTPLKYFPQGPITISPRTLKEKKAELKDFNFMLQVDSRELFKPIILPSGNMGKDNIELERKYDYVVKPVNIDRVVDGEPLKCHGYLYWQRTQVEPSNLRGIEVYIRNVGIGPYDYTLMNFATRNPAHRAAQVSGEIYVDKGLERALNIDRNSFRKTDAHYLALQDKIWEMLGSGARKDGILGTSVDSYYLRKDRDEAVEKREHIDNMTELVKAQSEGHLDLGFSNRDESQPYVIEGDSVTVFEKAKAWPRAAKQRHLYQMILLTIEAAIARGATPKEILDAVKELLLKKVED